MFIRLQDTITSASGNTNGKEYIFPRSGKIKRVTVLVWDDGGIVKTTDAQDVLDVKLTMNENSLITGNDSAEKISHLELKDLLNSETFPGIDFVKGDKLNFWFYHTVVKGSGMDFTAPITLRLSLFVEYTN